MNHAAAGVAELPASAARDTSTNRHLWVYEAPCG